MQGKEVYNSIHGVEESNLCYICFMDKFNAFSGSCGHGGLCEFCAEDLHNFYLGCPICAKSIDKVLVYEGSIETSDLKIVKTIRNRVN